MYKQISKTEARIELNNVIFILNSKEQDLSILGIDISEEMIEEEKSRAAIHARMLEDFEDEKKLNVFVSLLEVDPSTAYTSYLTTQKIK